MLTLSRSVSNFLSLVRGRKQSEGEPTTVSPLLLSLASVSEELNRLNKLTEADFLAVGALLAEVNSSARSISKEIAAQTDLISGEQGQVACDALASVLNRAGDMQRDAVSTNENLLHLSESIGRIHSGFAGFQETVSSFRLVATLARIETERLGTSDSSVAHLAEGFDQHTGKVVDRVNDVLDDVVLAQRSISTTVTNVSNLQGQKLETLPSLILSTQDNLQAFRARQAQAVRSSSALAEQFRALSNAISEIVMAIQSHDITRQQIEHVEETVADLAHAQQAERRSSLEVSSGMGMILHLQCVQLQEADRVFGASLDSIDRQLATIFAQIEEMIAEHKHLLDLESGSGQQSFLAEMQRSFAEILDRIGNCDELEDKVESAIAELSAIFDRLDTSLGDIRSMAIQVKWLALNARIGAVHLGHSGEPLNVIAESMQGLGLDCEARSNGTEEQLASMRKTVTPPDADSPAGLSIDVTAVRARIEGLKRSGEQALGKWQSIDESASSLKEHIASARERLSIRHRVSEVLKGCEARLQPFSTEMSPEQIEQDATLKSELERIAQRYTMQQEREIHARVVTHLSAVVMEQSCVTEDLSPSDTEFGDNIDLF